MVYRNILYMICVYLIDQLVPHPRRGLAIDPLPSRHEHLHRDPDLLDDFQDFVFKALRRDFSPRNAGLVGEEHHLIARVPQRFELSGHLREGYHPVVDVLREHTPGFGHNDGSVYVVGCDL